jgi:Ca-activated chloride channel family protein
VSPVLHRLRLPASIAALVLAAWSARVSSQTTGEPAAKLTIQITSPLGRTGLSGAVRLVARVTAEPNVAISPVQFFVDGKLVGEDKDGPPYAVEWVDDNPFEPRQILAQVADAAGREARDTVDLKPLEISETADVSSVLLEPTVIDPTGRPVNGLQVGDFHVSEDGVPQSIELAVPDTVPATYTLLIDTSQSMSRHMDFVRDAARQLPGYLRPNDEVVIVPFAKDLGSVTGPTKDRDTIAGAISAIRSGGGTAILDCLVKATQQVSATEGRHIVVLVTDGYDENSGTAFEDALQAIKDTQTTVYVIAISGVAGISLKGEDLLKRLATETGGHAFFPSREFQLADVHRVIASDVQQRYVVSYTPTNQKLDGTWRAITLTTSNPKFVVKVRDGYRAPAPPPIRPQLELTIRDLNREYLDITPADLEVLEDGVPQKVEGFEEALTPVSIVLVLDASGSMKKDAPQVIEAAHAFVRALPAKDKLAVMMFADKPELTHDLTTLREWSQEAIGRYQANGGTALYDALIESLTKLKPAVGRTAVVVLTDGRDENNPGTGPGSTHTLDDVFAMLKDVGATVYGIGLGPKVDRDTLERLALASTGEAYFPADVSELNAEYRRVIENLRRRYVISYTSTNSTHDGKWRTVEIRTEREGILIDSKGGYFAPESK